MALQTVSGTPTVLYLPLRSSILLTELASLDFYLPNLSVLFYKFFRLLTYDIYQASSWEAERSYGFLCYLFGCLVDPEENDTTRDIGEFVGYALLTGKDLSEAIAFARSCWEYDSAMSKLWWYLLKCQRYLEKVPDGSITRGTGEWVGTFGDWIENVSVKAGEARPVGQLLEHINHSPGWVGDDFDDCLEDVNRVQQ